jgi:hypothetical protein
VVPNTIREKKELTAEAKATLNQALGEFNQLFQPTAAPAPAAAAKAGS